MKDFKISVLIVTCNRSVFLKDCLESLKKQSYQPNKVLVVDNASDLKTEKVIHDFKKHLPITYALEKIKGEAFARNKALSLAKGDIFVFIDDDCIADKNWLKNINNFFKKKSKINGLVGRTENLFKKNPYACVAQCYYCRWLTGNFKNINKIQPLSSKNTFFDTKNLAFKKEIVKGFSFDPSVLFHSVDVDNVAGSILLKKGKFVYLPSAIVYHHNWSSFKELMIKNFFQGVANELILDRKKINSRSPILIYNYQKIFKLCLSEIKELNFFRKIIFWLMVFAYPWSYKAGRIFYKIKKDNL